MEMQSGVCGGIVTHRGSAPDLPDAGAADAGTHTTRRGPYWTHQGEDHATMRKLLRRTASNLTNREGAAGAPGPEEEADRPPIISLPKMTPGDDVEAFLEVHGRGVWPPTRSVGREPPSPNDAACLSYPELCQALVDRLGLTQEGHRQRFQGIWWEGGTRPFALAHQLLDAAGLWLLPGERSAQQVVEEVVCEGFLWALPPSTAKWVTCHRPASLEGEITLPPRSQGERGAGGPLLISDGDHKLVTEHGHAHANVHRACR